MKKLLVAALAALSFTSASATTWWVNGVLFGNVCRAGAYYTVYPLHNGQPVGTSCPVRDPYGYVIAQGVVTTE